MRAVKYRPPMTQRRGRFAGLAVILLAPLVTVAWTMLSAPVTAAQVNPSERQVVVAKATDTANPPRFARKVRLHLNTPTASGRRLSPSCFPTLRVKPSTPGPVPIPQVEPVVPGPVPMPRLATLCESDGGLTNPELPLRPQRSNDRR